MKKLWVVSVLAEMRACDCFEFGNQLLLGPRWFRLYLAYHTWRSDCQLDKYKSSHDVIHERCL